MSGRDVGPFIYGGLASIAAEFGTFPIDTTKTRLQIQGQKVDQIYSKLRYHGMTDAFLKISREEGLHALYSGIWPAVLRQATYGTIKFGTYYTLKSYAIERGLLVDAETGTESVWGNVLCAAAAGAVSSAIANPTDVLKVRMQVHGKGTQHKGLWRCFHEVYQHEGLCGLWRGVGPTAQRAVVIASVELPVYDFCKHHLMDAFGDSVANHFFSSFVASLGSAIASTPIDVVRTRLMNQKYATLTNGGATATARKFYNGSIDCAVQHIPADASTSSRAAPCCPTRSTKRKAFAPSSRATWRTRPSTSRPVHTSKCPAAKSCPSTPYGRSPSAVRNSSASTSRLARSSPSRCSLARRPE